jgi:hypothetical protein
LPKGFRVGKKVEKHWPGQSRQRLNQTKNLSKLRFHVFFDGAQKREKRLIVVPIEEFLIDVSFDTSKEVLFDVSFQTSKEVLVDVSFEMSNEEFDQIRISSFDGEGKNGVVSSIQAPLDQVDVGP